MNNIGGWIIIIAGLILLVVLFKLKKDTWEFKGYKEHEWFRFLAILLLVIVGLYLLSHYATSAWYQRDGYEYSKLDERQQQHINRIYFGEAETSGNDTGTTPDPDETTDSDETTDTTSLDAGEIEAAADSKEQQAMSHDTACPTAERTMKYLTNEFSNKVDSIQLSSVTEYLKCCKTDLEAVSFLSNVRFKVKSYFWLIGPAVYFEIVFWSLFGVLGSLLFNLGAVSKNSTTVIGNPRTEFDNSEIPYQVSKLLYAPICTLVIILGYNFFKDENIVDISSSKGVIVFAFIGGFYSARVIAFLDRLKDLLLPHSGTTPGNIGTTTSATTGATATTGTNTNGTTAADTNINSNRTNSVGTNNGGTANNPNTDGTRANETNIDEEAAASTTADGITTPILSSLKVKNLSIELGFDPSSLTAEQQTQLRAVGLGSAVVLLRKTEGSDPVVTAKIGDEASHIFVVDELEPGSYTVTATWTQELQGTVLTLDASQSTEINTDDAKITLTLKKS